MRFSLANFVLLALLAGCAMGWWFEGRAREDDVAYYKSEMAKVYTEVFRNIECKDGFVNVRVKWRGACEFDSFQKSKETVLEVARKELAQRHSVVISPRDTVFEKEEDPEHPRTDFDFR